MSFRWKRYPGASFWYSSMIAPMRFVSSGVKTEMRSPTRTIGPPPIGLSANERLFSRQTSRVPFGIVPLRAAPMVPMKPISSALVKSRPTWASDGSLPKRSIAAIAAASAARSSHAWVCSSRSPLVADGPLRIAAFGNFQRAMLPGPTPASGLASRAVTSLNGVAFASSVRIVASTLRSVLASKTSSFAPTKYGSFTPPRNSSSSSRPSTFRTTNAG